MGSDVIKLYIISAVRHAPYLLFLGFYISFLMNISRRERGVILHNYSVSQKALYWLSLTWKNALVFAFFLGVIVFIARYSQHRLL